MALGNRRQIDDLLFASAWSALKQTIGQEQGYDPAALLMLHTWNQQLEAHHHVHAVVAGGGPALDGSGWVSSRRGPLSAGDSSELYLVDAIDLRRCYRDHFLAGLTRLMLEEIDAPLPEDALEFNVMADPSLVEQDEVPHQDCPLCGCELRLIEMREKPSWYDVMNSPSRPTWYTFHPHTTDNLVSKPRHPIESAKGSSVPKATKLNARSIPLHPTPG